MQGFFLIKVNLDIIPLFEFWSYCSFLDIKVTKNTQTQQVEKRVSGPETNRTFEKQAQAYLY